MPAADARASLAGVSNQVCTRFDRHCARQLRFFNGNWLRYENTNAVNAPIPGPLPTVSV